MWDSAQLNRQADSSLYETYRPTEDDTLSFEELRRLNPEVFGWLTVYGTHIDYPLTQGEDNSKYVNTDAKGSFSLSGSLFLDYRNDRSFRDVNSIIYGHHMEKEKMFGEVESFSQETYFDGHRYGSVYDGERWQGIEFFAFLSADAYDPVLYDAKLQGEDGRERYLAYVREHAMNFRDISFRQDDRYIALSTCTTGSTNGRHLLVGRLTEKPEKDPFAGREESGR